MLKFIIFKVNTNGRLSLLRQGYLFCQLQLSKGLNSFCDVLSPVSLENFKVCETIDTDDSQSENEEHVNEEDENLAQELDLPLLLSIGAELCPTNICITANEVMLPPRCSQSYINGRNGSNACTTISIIVGSYVLRSEMLKDGLTRELCSLFIGCMEMGNILHNDNGFLACHESLALVPSDECEMGEEHNCFPNDIAAYLSSLGLINQFVIITGRGETICCLSCSEKFFFFDSHTHGDKGGSISVMDCTDIAAMNNKFLHLSNNELMYMCVMSVLF